MVDTRSADDLTRDPQGDDRLDEAERIVGRARKTNDPQALKKQALDDKNRALQEEADLLWVLGQPAGVRFIARVMGICGVDQPFYHPNNGYMCEVAGRRSIAGQLKTWIRDADFEAWVAVDRELERGRPKSRHET
jgi:hypothetical protein